MKKNQVIWKIKRAGLLGLVLLLGLGNCFAVAGCKIAGPEEISEEKEEDSKPEGSLWDLFLGAGNSEGKTEEETFLKKANNLKSLINMYYWEEAEESDLYEGMYHGMLESLGDPYSCYYTKEEYAALMEEMEGTYCGIGALVSQNASTKAITIVRPFVDGPAYNAGMLPGDVIVNIDGEDVSTWDLELAVKHMKGEQGTKVEVKVWRASASDYVEMTITRDLVEVETVTYQMLEDSIGYIYVMQFDEVTTQQFETALNALKSQGMKGLVVDIRDNGGGLLTTVCDMLDLFLEEELIVYTVDKYDAKEEIFAKEGSIGELPMAILINGFSASASEIFSGAMQDYGLATIVGTQSFGKGIVQSVIPLNDGSAVKLTVSTYYTPNGRNIHGLGITPDVEVELEEELKKLPVIPLEEDNQLQCAVNEIKKQLQ
ncbi:MAG: S41 family peptidase [Lachnospiraceae bacterium]|nr:S41 family peptidase [Lachnospiraceae bacterium]